jgi:glycerophosphoryl diester phosphodiesterase
MSLGLTDPREMLEMARQKSTDLENVRWVQADMRLFELDEAFGLVVILGHAFQNLLTPEDQVACLECIKTQLSAAVAQKIREAGIEIHAWDVNDEASLKTMLALNIPRICTDELRQALEFRASVTR